MNQRGDVLTAISETYVKQKKDAFAIAQTAIFIPISAVGVPVQAMFSRAKTQRMNGSAKADAAGTFVRHTKCNPLNCPHNSCTRKSEESS